MDTQLEGQGEHPPQHLPPGGDGGLNSGIDSYQGETGLLIYNNTFDGGGKTIGDFAGPTISMSGGSTVASLRNNLITFSRNQNNDSPGDARVIGGASAYSYADYNAFYSPDNDNKIGYDFSVAGTGTHDVADGQEGQLAANPFAGARIMADRSREIESTIDEAAIWQGTQKVSQVLAIFRDRYSPRAWEPVAAEAWEPVAAEAPRAAARPRAGAGRPGASWRAVAWEVAAATVSTAERTVAAARSPTAAAAESPGPESVRPQGGACSRSGRSEAAA